MELKTPPNILIHSIESIHCINGHSQCAIQPGTCSHEIFMKDLGTI